MLQDCVLQVDVDVVRDGEGKTPLAVAVQRFFTMFSQPRGAEADAAEAGASRVVALLLEPPGQRPGAAQAGAPDPIRDVIGLRQEPGRIAHLLAQFAPLLAEIETLRSLDLAQIHPPIIFDPSLPYRPVPHD